jgi:transglutaminase-like putative cysteine protease
MVNTAARAHLAATLVFIASVLFVASHVPLWCASVAMVSAAWRLSIGLGWLQLPRRRRGMGFLFGALTALLVVAVIASFRTINGLAAGTALLVVMGALKLVETRTRRDDGIVIGVSLFLLLAAALATQSLWRLPFYLLIVWLACAAIALIAYEGDALRTRAALRLSARALAMSAPLALACFLFFPRIAGQFWALERGDQSTTGLSDQMSPGSISRLANEYDPAFRVHFVGKLPPRETLYWRGPVLNSFDGYTWRRERTRFYLGSPLEMLGDPVRYRVTLEPTNQPWMFALDTVDESPRHDVYLSHDRQLSAMERITEAVSYDAVSHLDTRSTGELSKLGRRFETMLPEGRNPRAYALAHEIRARNSDDAAFARAVLEWFRTNGLEYSLEPGTTSLDSVDTTLFDSKLGFCGHFASAYAMMMRSVGVPARVVTGYLGGEWNPIGSYLIVRQSDAHAWTEIWLDRRGWTRVDPTAVVAPERLQQGILDLFTDSLPATMTFRRNPWLSRLGQLWDGANQLWQERVVEFNFRAQLDLLRKLGIESPGWRDLGWIFALGLSLWIAWVSLSLRRSVARFKPDRLGRAWLRATRRLARVAPPRAAHEGPMDYARRVGALRPELAPRVAALAAHYARLRYGVPAPHHEIAEFERAVSRLGV